MLGSHVSIQESSSNLQKKSNLGCRLILCLAMIVLSASTSLAEFTVTGSVSPTNPSTWTSSTYGYIGYTADGTLTVNNGSDLLSYYGYLGYNSGTTGVVTITGDGSTWTNSKYLYIGYNSIGTLNITDGAAVRDTTGYIGYTSSSTGAVTVDGSGSTWTHSGNLYVGSAGNGTLNITNDGTVSVTGTTSVGSNGTIDFGSKGGMLTTGTLCSLLSQITGIGTITTYGIVSDIDLLFDATHPANYSTLLSNSSDQNIAFNLDLSGVTKTGDLGIGYTGHGSMVVKDGVIIKSKTGYIGYSSGSTGIVTVEGEGSTWTNSGNLYVGNSGSGTLNITNGGMVIADEICLGKNGQFSMTGSNSILCVNHLTGFDTNLNLSGSLYIGQSGGSASGSYTIGDNQNFYIGKDLELGYSTVATFTQTGGTNTVTNGLIFGSKKATYTLSGGILSVGGNITTNSSGSTMIIDGGTLNTEGSISVGYFHVGYNSGSEGSFILKSGQSLSATTGIYFDSAIESIGYQGNGRFTNSGGTNNIGGTLYLGYKAGSTGEYLLNSGTVTTSDLYIGSSGGGIYRQSDGATKVNNSLYLGYNSGSCGLLELSNGQLSARWESLAYNGDGRVVQTGGINTISDDLSLGYNSTYTATYDLSGDGQVSANYEYIGDKGKGLLIQSGDSTNSAMMLHIGYNSSATGSYELSGDAQLTVSSWLIVGSFGSGTFVQSGNSQVTTGVLSIGAYDSGSGSYLMENTSQLTANSEYIGEYGPGSFTQAGGTNTVAGDLELRGTYDLSGSGQLVADDVYVSSSSSKGTATFNQYGGTVDVNDYLRVGDAMYYGPGHVGNYNLYDGQVTAKNEYIGTQSDATFNQIAGINKVTSSLMLGGGSNSGIYNLSGTGVLSAYDEQISSNGIFNQESGEHNVSWHIYLYGQYNLIGGTLSFEKGTNHQFLVRNLFSIGNETGTGNVTETGTGDGTDLVVREVSYGTGTVQGWGNLGLTGSLNNNGLVISEGYGVNRTLDLSSFSTVTNTIENTTTNGWYAVDHGKLTLPALAIATGSNSYNWGESASDTQIDLVNSAKLSFSNVISAGNLSLSLLASDRDDIPTGLDGWSLLSVYDMEADDALSFSSVDLTFRYDKALADSMGIGSAPLYVLAYDGTDWINVTSNLNSTKNLITVEDQTALSYFIIGTLLGDANGDLTVDVSDLGILAANYGKSSGVTWGMGDFNDDGIVDVGDLGILAAHYSGSSAEIEAFTSNVPEPMTLSLLTLAGLAGILRRR